MFADALELGPFFRLCVQILKIPKGTNTGISTGDYDEEHKILRQRFHQTLTKLSGRDKVDEIVQDGFYERQNLGLVESREISRKLIF